MAEPALRTYDPSELTPIDATSLDCCRNWVRFMTKDRPDFRGNYSERSFLDSEINAQLELDQVVDDSQNPEVVYYRPHIAATKLVKGDPERFTYISLEGYAKTYVDPAKTVAIWLDDGKKFDSQIPAELLAQEMPDVFEPTVMGQITR